MNYCLITESDFMRFVGEYKNIFEGAGLTFLAWDPFFQMSPKISYRIIKIFKSHGDSKFVTAKKNVLSKGFIIVTKMYLTYVVF